MTTVADGLFAVLLALCIGLPVLDVVWRRWRTAHPARRAPSRADWARLRRADERAAEARRSTSARDPKPAVRSAAAADGDAEARRRLRARRAAVRRRLAVVADQCRSAARTRPAAPPDGPPPGWTRAISGTLT
ncbi:hypothetical protein FHR81_003492 [Actinoalloteichus hoggarensis]|uniref:Uncharacterized protein n=1 Tax=Actinoalloteichus hoggarensis TaxID=1470176 RepID=A0A221W7B8_9PSEU|nr:hypothetical protein [Actinoalloteichus hoggarensis]ASO21842.1 hypothetical protein AHOG_21130 [Actinoalloteichus hoggarensis]MBB5922440.1 hypothetical protein [Actinoalloteichus hoggarensis]